MPPRPEKNEPLTLSQALADLWYRFTDGVQNRHSAFHTPTVATFSSDGGPSARTVVLRDASESERSLRFHTDKRSSKFRELQISSAISLHVYDREDAIQVRIWGQATVHTDDALADQAWRESRQMSRLCYGAAEGPGTLIAAPFAAPTQIDEAFARANFACVSIKAERMEWLSLKAKGHQRAAFQWAGDIWTSHWLAP